MKQKIHFFMDRSPILFQICVLGLTICLLLLVQNFLRPGSVTIAQLMNVSRQSSSLGIVAIGQAFVILTGGIDLSVGSVLTLTNVIAVSIMKGSNENFWEAVLVCLLIGFFCGTLNGFGVLKLKIAPFLMTLCTMSIVQGIYLVYTGGSPSGNVSPLLKTIGNGFLYMQIPYSTLVWIIIAIVCSVLLHETTYGRKLFSVGSNPLVADLCGVNSDAVKFSAYILSSVFAVIAGLLASGYIGTTSLSIGSDYVNNSLAAVLISGNAIEGGRGGVWNCVFGTFFLMLLFAILTMANISQVGKLIVQGGIIWGVTVIQGVLQK